MKDLLFSLQENELLKKIIGDVDLTSFDSDQLQETIDKIKDFVGESEEENQLLAGIIKKIETVYDMNNVGNDIKNLVDSKGAGMLKGLFKK